MRIKVFNPINYTRERITLIRDFRIKNYNLYLTTITNKTLTI